MHNFHYDKVLTKVHIFSIGILDLKFRVHFLNGFKFLLVYVHRGILRLLSIPANIYWKVQNKIRTMTPCLKRDREALTGGRGRDWEMKTGSDFRLNVDQPM